MVRTGTILYRHRNNFLFIDGDLGDFEGGAFGENLTLSGGVEREVCVGDIYRIGKDALVQVSQPRQPCWKLSRRWRIKDLTKRVEVSGFTGFYFRVLNCGYVESEQELELVERGQYSVDFCNQIKYKDKNNRKALDDLSKYAPLSANWKDGFVSRLRSY